MKVDGATGTMLARLHLGGTPSEAADGPDGLVWVTDKERSLVYRIYGPRASVTDSFPAGPGACSLGRRDVDHELRRLGRAQLRA